MEAVTKQYTKGSLTVTWKPEQCIHSKVCWTELLAVFDPRRRPWVNMEGADEARIAAQVRRCPSGALSYVTGSAEANSNNTETATATIVEVMKNGPLMVYGSLTVKHSNGTETQQHKVTAFCRCGASANKPFCDGSHIKAGFKDQ